MDRRRAVYRLVISPERAHGLDLEKVTRVAVGRLESEMGVTNLQWIAAIHRNTRHHHVHLVVAGMHEDGQGGYRRLDLTKPRLAALKEAVGLEIERERGPLHRVPAEVTSVISGSLLRLRAVARRYQRQMQRDAELEVRRLGWERAA
jgi:type IV secretory pathway VirD2 relaxase